MNAQQNPSAESVELPRVRPDLPARGNPLERLVMQLKRLHDVSRPVTRQSGTSPLEETFVTNVCQVLEPDWAAVWLLSPAPPVVSGFAMRGACLDRAAWREAGPEVADLIAAHADRTLLQQALASVLPGAATLSIIGATSEAAQSAVRVVLLAGEDRESSARPPALSDESVDVLALLAEKCADHFDASMDRQTFESQVRQLRESEERLDLVLRGTNDGWWDWDLRTDKCVVSARWMNMLGYGDDETSVREGFWHEEIHEDDRVSFGWNLEGALTGEIPSVEAEVRLRCSNNDYLPVLVRGTVTRDPSGVAVRFAGSVLDLRERKRYEAHVHHLAFYDVLTELPNRRLLIDRLQQGLLAKERTNQLSAVLMLDLDRFKVLNDTHGHAAGDELLGAVARRLRQTVRAHDTVARLGGDEFVLLLEDLGTDPEECRRLAESLANKALAALNEPYVLDVGVTHHSASIGVALTDEPGITVDTVLKRADVALYEAKAAGRNMVQMFEPAMQSRVDLRSELESRLRDGFVAREFRLLYQPQVDSAGNVKGVEALMRWVSGEETISPEVFIPVAEDSGQIHRLGAWSLEEACWQSVAWRDVAPPGFRIAVNVSAPEFLQSEYTKTVLETLDRTGARGEEIRLEITEANVVADLEFAAARMMDLRRVGLEFSLDDFGTGYSSLTYLRRLPVSEVKIDKSYVDRFMRNRHDAAIMRAIFMLCSSLDIEVVAEGVETEAQRDLLMEFGCRIFQGYLYGPAGAPSDDPRNLVLPSAPRLLTPG